jgi:HlyD family secretion protein
MALKLRRAHVLALVVVVAAAAVAAIALRGRAEDVRYVTAPVERGDVLEVVGATGTLQAVTTVQVGSQVSGTVQSLHADFNSQVKKGQVIARLDPSLLQARLGQSQAALVSAQANVERARATLQDAQQKAARAQQLANENLLPAADLETARATQAEAAAQLKATQASVTQAAANVRQAQVDVAHTVITTPIDGVVVARNVDVGQTVAASLQAPTLFVIANDLSRLQVSASIDEADVGRVRAGQQATFRVDAFPNEEFEGTVEQVRLQPITVQNVVTYNTIIGVNNAGQRLMPGMTATVSVIVNRRDDVLRVPAAALRFRPEGFDPASVRPQRTAAGAGTPAADASAGSPGGDGGQRRRRGPRAEGGGGGGAATDAAPGAGRDRGAGGFRPVFVFTPGPDGEPQPVRIRQGISDGQFVEVVDGLAEGATVITGVTGGETAAGRAPGRGGASPASNPFQPQRPQRRTR